MPTSYELNELTTSGAVPARIAATILSSLMLPTTSSDTLGFAFWYSAASFLKAVSSRALQPTQTVSLVGAEWWRAPPDAVPATASASPSSAATRATRFIAILLPPKWCSLDTFTRRPYDLLKAMSMRLVLVKLLHDNGLDGDTAASE